MAASGYRLALLARRIDRIEALAQELGNEAIALEADAFDKSAGKLGVDRIDLLILHQALPTRFDLTQEAYRALETLIADGRVQAIGVSNFMPEHLDD